MTRKDLINAVRSKLNLSAAQAQAAVDAVLGTLEETLTQGDTVRLHGFGVFKVKDVASRLGRNPMTNKTIQLPPRRFVQYKPERNLKARMDEALRASLATPVVAEAAS